MEDILTTTQAAEKLGISARRVAALITAGKLPANQFGGSWMIRSEDLALVSDRKPGRPKKPGEGETTTPAASVTATAAQSKKTAGKGTLAVETKPAKKRTGKKGKVE